RRKKETKKKVIIVQDITMYIYYKHKEEKHPNLLVINISPDEGITLYINAKKTGAGNQAEPINLSYNHDKRDGINTPEAYEKLIYDCMAGDTTNFTHWDEVSLTWQFVDTSLEDGKAKKADFANNPVGSMGPEGEDELLEKDGHHWWSIIEGTYNES